MKNRYTGGIAYEGGLGQFADLRGEGLAKKRVVVFLREGLLPRCTLCASDNQMKDEDKKIEIVQDNASTHKGKEVINM